MHKNSRTHKTRTNSLKTLEKSQTYNIRNIITKYNIINTDKSIVPMNTFIQKPLPRATT